MDIVLSKSEISGEVKIPPSKSVAHRVMIAEALAGNSLFVEGGGKDISATANCLFALKNAIENFRRGGEKSDETVRLNAGESGSTLRFLLPVACAVGANAIFDGEGRLKDRPLCGLVETLNSHGADIRRFGDSQLPLLAGGKLVAGEYKIDGSVSSQYITGLLFALPLLDGDSKLTILHELVSKNYVDITLGVLADYGIDVRSNGGTYFIKGNQRYVSRNVSEVESDWSSAGFMLALGVLTGDVALKGLRANSLQGDKIVVDLLRKAGADITEKDGVFFAKKSALKAIDFDAQNCPDAVPIMATALSFANGASNISHVDRLRDKESDRLGAIIKMLSAFGVKTEYGDGVLTVFGGEHRACVTESFNDHRMAMSAMVCALATEGESKVLGAECIAKSYPDFANEIIRLGARAEIK